MSEALRRAEALEAWFPPRSASEITDEIMFALGEGRPYSLLRLTADDGADLFLSVEDEAEFAALYAVNRRELRSAGDAAVALPPDQVDRALRDADCLGALHVRDLEREYAAGGVRGVPSLFNLVRKLESLRDADAIPAGRVKLTDAHIDQVLLVEGLLERLLNTRSRLAVIGADPELPQRLKGRFGLDEVFFHQSPRAGVGSRADLDRISAELTSAHAGVLHLVAAGAPGKLFCDLIKRAGGVAVDLGEDVDLGASAFLEIRSPGAAGAAHDRADRQMSPALSVLGPEDYAGAAEIRAGDPPIEEHEDVYYLPFQWEGQWGIFDRADQIVDASVDRYLPDDHLMRQIPTSYLRADEVTECLPDGDYLYGGRFNGHFGHFLVESISRLWPLAEGRRPGQKIVMHGDQNPGWWFSQPWVADVFRGLELGPEDFVHADRPFRIPRLTVPRTSFQQQKYGYEAYARVCRAVGRRLLGDEVLTPDPRPVWLSKARMVRGVRKLLNEREVETVLQRHGVEVIHPEELSFVDKVRLFATRPVTGTWLSAMHVCIFAPPSGGRQVWVHPYPKVNTNSIIVDLLNGNDVVYLMPNGASETHRPGGPFMVTAEVTEPAAMAYALLERLG